jgi:hypothetical protein
MAYFRYGGRTSFKKARGENGKSIVMRILRNTDFDTRSRNVLLRRLQGKILERSNFARRETSIFSFGKMTEDERADGNAMKRKHAQANLFAHFSDLAVAAFGKGHFQLGLMLPPAQGGYLDGLDAITVYGHRGGKTLKLCRRDLAADHDVINLGKMVEMFGKKLNN